MAQILTTVSTDLFKSDSLVAQTVKHLPAMQETRVRSLGWKIPWRRKWQSTPVLLPGKSHGQRIRVGTLVGLHGVAKSRTRLSSFTSPSRPALPSPSPASRGQAHQAPWEAGVEKRGLDRCFLIYLHHQLAGPHCLRCRRGL